MYVCTFVTLEPISRFEKASKKLKLNTLYVEYRFHQTTYFTYNVYTVHVSTLINIFS